MQHVSFPSSTLEPANFLTSFYSLRPEPIVLFLSACLIGLVILLMLFLTLFYFRHYRSPLPRHNPSRKSSMYTLDGGGLPASAFEGPHLSEEEEDVEECGKGKEVVHVDAEWRSALCDDKTSSPPSLSLQDNNPYEGAQLPAVTKMNGSSHRYYNSSPSCSSAPSSRSNRHPPSLNV